jgi:hypothetical protein
VSARFQGELDHLAKLLRKEPLTARQITERTGCCKPAAYQRVQALIDRGENVFIVTERQKRPGPVSRAFGIR